MRFTEWSFGLWFISVKIIVKADSIIPNTSASDQTGILSNNKLVPTIEIKIKKKFVLKKLIFDLKIYL